MKKLKRYGFWSTFPSINLIDISINAGFDFVIFDMEHGTHDLNSIASSALLLKRSGCNIYSRIPQKGFSLIQRLHDIGVDGILFPMLHNEEEILKARVSTMFEPQGKLGYNPFVKKFEYGGNNSPNNLISCIGMIEDLSAFDEALNSYIKFNLDGCYVGAYDMNIKAGYRGDMMNKEFIKKLNKCYESLSKHKDNLKTFGMNLESSKNSNFRNFNSQNFSDTCMFVDAGNILDTWKRTLENNRNF